MHRAGLQPLGRQRRLQIGLRRLDMRAAAQRRRRLRHSLGQAMLERSAPKRGVRSGPVPRVERLRHASGEYTACGGVEEGAQVEQRRAEPPRLPFGVQAGGEQHRVVASQGGQRAPAEGGGLGAGDSRGQGHDRRDEAGVLVGMRHARREPAPHQGEAGCGGRHGVVQRLRWQVLLGQEDGRPQQPRRHQPRHEPGNARGQPGDAGGRGAPRGPQVGQRPE
mmetsp:Transcript_31192/g.100706  ORF Transcript_31192/g.100706 Transcript_31192/m.100706 type:complete len:221 (+) Transcript_31192:206-868(+)